MHDWTRKQLKSAIRFMDHETVAELGKNLISRNDVSELRDMIRREALPFEYAEIGNTMFYDGDIEIDTFSVSGTGRRRR